MGNTRNTGYLQNIVQYDASNNIILPSLIGTGTRMVVSSSTGLLSTQAIPTLSDLSGVPTSRTLTINGVTYDLTANRAWSALPVGGAAGDILAKIDGTDYNATWIPNYTSTVQHTVKAGVALTKGQAVYVSSADGTNMIVSKASNASEQTSSKTLGLVAQNLATNGQGFVVTEGLLAGLNTNGANAGDPVWLGTDGNLIFGLLDKPYAPAHLVFIGIVTRVNANNGEIFVKVQNGFELDELHDLSVKNASDGDMIKYVASTGLWTKTAASTTNIVEGTNLYYTNARARLAISLTTSGTSGAATYDNTTGVLNIPQYQGGVTSFNTRTGAVTLSSGDVTTALGYTPVTNARTLTINGTTYDLSANRSWTIAPDTSVRNIYTFTATAAQTTFTIEGGYTVGLIDVFINGVKLASADFTATNGTTVVLGTGTGVGNIVEIVKYVSAFTTAVENIRTLTINGVTYDLSANRTWSITNASLGAQPQLDGTGLVRMSGTTVSYDNATYATQSYVTTALANLVDSAPGTLDTLNELAAALGDDPNFATTVATSIGTKQPQLNGTGFVKISGTTISYDNSTYLTTASASSTYVPYTGATGNVALGSYSLSLNSLAVNSIGANNNGLGDIGALGGNTFRNVYANSFVRTSGTSSQFLKADGSVDSSTYLTTASASSTYLPLAGGTLTGALGGTSASFSSSVTAQTNLGIINVNASQAGFVAEYTGTGALKVSFSTYNDIMNIYNETNGYSIMNFTRSTKNLVINPTGSNVGIGITDLGPDGLYLPGTFNYSWSEGSGNAYAVLFRQRNSAATVMASGYKRSNTGSFASSYGISMSRAAIAVGYNNGSIAFFSDSATNVANGTDTTPSERMTILNNGKVGIGETLPDNTYQGLTIKGTDPSLRLKTTSGSGWVWTEYVTSAGVNNFSMGVNQTLPYFGIKAGAGLDNPSFSMLTNGNIGVSITAPTQKLSIRGNQVFTNQDVDGVANALIAEISSQARGYANQGSNMASIQFRTSSAAWFKGDIAFLTNNSDGTNPAVAATERMRITSDGLVRITSFASNSLVGTDAAGNLGVVNNTYTEIPTGTITYSMTSNAAWGINNSFPATIRNYTDEGMAGSASDSYNATINRGVTFDLGSAKAVRKIVERGYPTMNLDNILVQYSTDNSNWTSIHTYTHVYGNTQKNMEFNPTGAIAARYWRWLISGWVTREVQNYYTYESIIYT